MKIIYNNIIPFKGFTAINLFGVLFARRGVQINQYVINHEKIHTAQMRELAYVFFYVFYLIEWVGRLFQHKFHSKEAYRNISFEKEAYGHEFDLNYLEGREPYAMWE